MQRAEVRRVVLISAVSARPDVATDYAATKLAGEAALRDSGLRWTIFRPS
ncbi:MAG: complex I NDUFA9 subunit family protein, partial [Sphingomonadales bacterium]